MNITKDLIPGKRGIRTGYKLTRGLGLVIHWIGVPQSKATVIRRNFEREQFGTHYISDHSTGDIVQCVPEDEVTYHVGSDNGYTELTRRLIGRNNPNWYFVGVECCIGDKSIPADWYERGKHTELGRPSDKQYAALVEFAADFLGRHGLTPENGLFRHYDITGKLCHVWFTKDFERWEQFKADVRAKMKGDVDMTKEEVQALIEAAKPEVYRSMDEVPKWAQELVSEAVDKGIIKGDGTGKLNLTDTDLKTLSMVLAARKGSV